MEKMTGGILGPRLQWKAAGVGTCFTAMLARGPGLQGVRRSGQWHGCTSVARRGMEENIR